MGKNRKNHRAVIKKIAKSRMIYLLQKAHEIFPDWVFLHAIGNWFVRKRRPRSLPPPLRVLSFRGAVMNAQRPPYIYLVGSNSTFLTVIFSIYLVELKVKGYSCAGRAEVGRPVNFRSRRRS